LKIKNRRLKILIFSITLLVAVFSIFYWKKFIKQVSEQEKIVPFSWIPIVSFSTGNLPCFYVEIEGQKYETVLDLGFAGQFSIFSELIPQIQNKTFVSTKSVCNWRGTEYQNPHYRVPGLCLGNITFNNALLEEESAAEDKESIIGKANTNHTHSPMKLGWKLFRSLGLTLFMDFKHGMIAICDNINTFTQYGYKLEKFVKTPALLDEGIIEMDTSTSDGSLRCFLDTGCTYNFWNDDYSLEEVEERIKDEKCFTTISTVHIGGKDFGKMVFRPLPLKFDPQVQAILGMDFFFEHQVLIDFKNEQIYIAVSQEEDKPDGSKVRF
jgi:hypothetical protein